jgi:molecular chaperone GrpE (heat shock protein)
VTPEVDSALSAGGTADIGKTADTGKIADTGKAVVAEQAGSPSAASLDEAVAGQTVAGETMAAEAVPGQAPAREAHGSVAKDSVAKDSVAKDSVAASDGAYAAGEPGTDAAIAELTAEVRRLATAAEQYQERARQREGVIDYLRSELDLLRRGERRGPLRPLLTAMSRLHADLLLQAKTLPADYNADKARELLESFAGTVESALADNGVAAYTPDPGDAFDPRRHRKVKGENTPDPALDGLVAAVRKSGYLDIEADSLLAPAEVTLYKTVKDEQ